MKTNYSIIMVFLMTVLCIGQIGCYNSPQNIEAFVKPFQQQVNADNYVLMPPDEIAIHSLKVPEMHLRRQRIRPDGKVSFENLGEIEVAGKTPSEIAEILKAKASLLYTFTGNHPIDVQVTAYRSQAYHVLGQVNRAGPVPYTGRDTAITAISLAQPQVTAWIKKIRVIRPSGQVGVEPKIFELNWKRIMDTGDTRQDVLLEAGDIIYVPPTILAALGMKIAEFVRPIGLALSPVVTISRISTYGI